MVLLISNKIQQKKSVDYTTVLDILKKANSTKSNICDIFDCITIGVSNVKSKVINVSATNNKGVDCVFLVDTTSNPKKYVKCTIKKIKTNNISNANSTYNITFKSISDTKDVTKDVTIVVTREEFKQLRQYIFIYKSGGKRHTKHHNRRHRKQKSTRRHTKRR